MNTGYDSQTNTESDCLPTYSEAAARLGVARNTLVVAGCRHKIVVIGSGRAARIPESEVLKWEKRFNQLNAPFAWLQPTVDAAPGDIKTVHPKGAGTRFGVSDRRVSEWCAQGLLPFFVRAFTEGSAAGGKDRRSIIKEYVFGLRDYVGRTPVFENETRDYFALCSRHKRIM